MASPTLWTLSHAQVAIEAVAILAFALSGLIEAARRRLDAVGICVVAFLTAFGGGTLRDIVCNQIPSAFSDHRPYALCAFCGGWVMVGAHALGAPHWLALSAAAATTSSLRLLALWTGWSIPAWQTGPGPRD